MESESQDMQDRIPSRQFKESLPPLRSKPSVSKKLIIGLDPANKEEKPSWVYSCGVCRLVIVMTEVAMDEEGLNSKMRNHKCVNPGKTDFENEVR